MAALQPIAEGRGWVGAANDETRRISSPHLTISLPNEANHRPPQQSTYPRQGRMSDNTGKRLAKLRRHRPICSIKENAGFSHTVIVRPCVSNENHANTPPRIQKATSRPQHCNVRSQFASSPRSRESRVPLAFARPTFGAERGGGDGRRRRGPLDISFLPHAAWRAVEYAADKATCSLSNQHMRCLIVGFAESSDYVRIHAFWRLGIRVACSGVVSAVLPSDA